MMSSMGHSGAGEDNLVVPLRSLEEVAGSAQLKPGVKFLSVQWSASLLAFSDGKAAFVVPLDSGGIAITSARELSLPTEVAGRVSELTWCPHEISGQLWLAVAGGCHVATFLLDGGKGSVLAPRLHKTWPAADGAWCTMRWHPSPEMKGVFVLAAQKEVVVCELLRGRLAAIPCSHAITHASGPGPAWAASGTSLCVAYKSHLQIIHWRKRGAWDSFHSRDLLPGGEGPVRAVAPSTARGFLVTTEAPVAVLASAPAEATGEGGGGAPPPREVGGMIDLRGAIGGAPSSVSFRSRSAGGGGAGGKSKSPASSPGGPKPPSPASPAAEPRDSVHACALPGLPVPDVLVLRGGVAYVGSSMASDLAVALFQVESAGLTPLRRMVLQSPTADNTVRIRGLAVDAPRMVSLLARRLRGGGVFNSSTQDASLHLGLYDMPWVPPSLEEAAGPPPAAAGAAGARGPVPMAALEGMLAAAGIKTAADYSDGAIGAPSTPAPVPETPPPPGPAPAAPGAAMAAAMAAAGSGSLSEAARLLSQGALLLAEGASAASLPPSAASTPRLPPAAPAAAPPSAELRTLIMAVGQLQDHMDARFNQVARVLGKLEERLGRVEGKLDGRAEGKP